MAIDYTQFQTKEGKDTYIKPLDSILEADSPLADVDRPTGDMQPLDSLGQPVQRSQPLEGEEEESVGLVRSIGDIPLGVARGVAGAATSAIGLIDWATGDDLIPDVPDAFGLPKTKTFIGSMVEGLSQFATGFIPAFGTLGALGKVSKLGGIGIKTQKAMNNARNSTILSKNQAIRKATGIKLGAEFVKSTAAGGVADFWVFKAQEERLSNLLIKFPALQNPVTEFLAAEEDDTEIEGRMKNFLEGLMLGGLIEPLITALRGVRVVRKAAREDKGIHEVIDELYLNNNPLKPTKEGEAAPPITVPLNDLGEWAQQPVRAADQAATPAARTAEAIDAEMYHGTRSETVTAGELKAGPNDIGVHVGTKEVAEGAGGVKQVLPITVSVNNPLRLIDRGDQFSPHSVASQLVDLGLAPPSWKNEQVRNNLSKEEVVEHIQSLGHDGIVYLNRTEGIDPKQGAIALGIPSSVTDAEFLAQIPRATDSVILFEGYKPPAARTATEAATPAARTATEAATPGTRVLSQEHEAMLMSDPPQIPPGYEVDMKTGEVRDPDGTLVKDADGNIVPSKQTKEGTPGYTATPAGKAFAKGSFQNENQTKRGPWYTKEEIDEMKSGTTGGAVEINAFREGGSPLTLEEIDKLNDEWTLEDAEKAWAADIEGAGRFPKPSQTKRGEWFTEEELKELDDPAVSGISEVVTFKIGDSPLTLEEIDKIARDEMTLDEAKAIWEAETAADRSRVGPDETDTPRPPDTDATIDPDTGATETPGRVDLGGEEMPTGRLSFIRRVNREIALLPKRVRELLEYLPHHSLTHRLNTPTREALKDRLSPKEYEDLLAAERDIAEEEIAGYGEALYPEGGQKPPDHPFNLFRISHSDYIRSLFDLQNGPYVKSQEFKDATQLKNADGSPLSIDQVIEWAAESNAFIGDLVGADFSKEALTAGNVSGELVRELAVKNHIMRSLVQQFVGEIDALMKKGLDGSPADLTKAMLLEAKQKELLAIVKENSQAFSYGLNVWKAKPKDVVPSSSITDFTEDMVNNPSFVEEFIKAQGNGNYEAGLTEMRKRAHRYQISRTIGNEVTHLKAADRRPSNSQLFIEGWMNGILSGPVTHAINATSNAISMFFGPVEQFAGGLITGNAAEMRQSISTFYYIFQQSIDAFKAAALTAKTEVDQLDEGFGGGLMERGGDRLMKSENRFYDAIGRGMNIPSAALLTVDVFFRNLNYRAKVKSVIMEETLANKDIVGRGPQAVADAVEKRFDTVVMDGQFYSYKNVRLKAERALKANKEIDKIEDPHERNVVSRKFIRKFMKDNWDENDGILAHKALQYTQEKTWTRALGDPDRAGLVQLAGGFQRLVNDYPLMRLIVPFIRTPTNLMAYVLERGPGVWAKTAKRGYKRFGKAFKTSALEAQDESVAKTLADGGESASELAGKIAIGSGLILLGNAAHANGIITGGGSADAQQRALASSAGHKTYSFNTENFSIEYRRGDPFSTFFAFISDVREAFTLANPSDQEALTAAMHAMGIAIARNIGSKQQLQGLTEVSNVLSNPEQYARQWFRSKTVTLLPFSSLLRQVFKTEEADEIKNVVHAVRAAVGLRNEGGIFETKVPHRYNILGEDPYDSTKSGRVAQFDFVTMAPMVLYARRPGDKLLERLAGMGHGFETTGWKVLDGVIDLENYHIASGPDEGELAGETWQKMIGHAKINGKGIRRTLEDLFRSPEFRAMAEVGIYDSKSPQIAKVRNVLSAFKKEAFERTLELHPELKRDYMYVKGLKVKERAGQYTGPLRDISESGFFS